MPLFTNDGNLFFGSEIVSINGTQFVAEDIDIQEKSTSIIRRDERNIPNGAVHIEDLKTGPMTLQLNSASDPIPENQSVISFPFRDEADKKWVITNVSQPKKQNEIRKLKVTVTEVLNPDNITTG